MKEPVPEWLEKCMSCQHFRRDSLTDADEVRCARKDGICKYKPYKKSPGKEKNGPHRF